MGHRTRVKGRVLVAGLAGALAVLGTGVVEGQRWGRPSVPRSGACFYRNADFRGDYFCVPAGEDLDQMPSGLNDRISSLRTFGGVEVIVFRNPGFGGRSSRFRDDVSNLQLEGWNDTMSSLSVRRVGGGFGGGGGRPTGDPDRLIRRAYEDLLDRAPDPPGLREYRRRIIDDGWSEEQVRDAIRRSPEYRQKSRMTRERAEEIVRRAYLSVLGREPDPGSEGFVTRVLRDKWTEADVARELRRSPEYRNRRPGQ
jgi:hypothetical protein